MSLKNNHLLINAKFLLQILQCCHVSTVICISYFNQRKEERGKDKDAEHQSSPMVYEFN